MRAEVGLIIPVHGELDALEECLESVYGGSERHIDVVLVDDGTPGGIEQISVKYPQCEIVSHPHRRGFTAAVNSGLRAAQNRWEACVLLNSDMAVTSGWCDALIGRWKSSTGIAA